jgi:transcriptional regulator with XRE-family HTH domain
MARQCGQRLAEEPKQRGLTQAQLAETMGVTPGRVSQIERGELSTIEAIARYVQALGGHLELVANFADHTLMVTTTEAAWQQKSAERHEGLVRHGRGLPGRRCGPYFASGPGLHCCAMSVDAVTLVCPPGRRPIRLPARGFPAWLLAGVAAGRWL